MDLMQKGKKVEPIECYVEFFVLFESVETSF